MNAPSAPETPHSLGIDPDGIGGYAYRARPELDDAVRQRMAEIRSFDYAAGAVARDRALPLRLAAYRPDGALPIDVWACGFVAADGHDTTACPAGLTPARSGNCWLPADGPEGGPWRDILDVWNTRPRLTDALAQHGVPAVQVDTGTGVVRRVVAALYDDEGGRDRLAVFSPGVPMPAEAALEPATLAWFATLVRGGSTGAVEEPTEVARAVMLR